MEKIMTKKEFIDKIVGLELDVEESGFNIYEYCTEFDNNCIHKKDRKVCPFYDKDDLDCCHRINKYQRIGYKLDVWGEM
jgi:hypothetical protein